MTSKTNEQALESAIEKALTGTCLEELKEQGIGLDVAADEQESYRTGNGFYIGHPNDFEAQYAIDKKRFWHFLKATQKEELEKLQKQNNWELKVLERLNRMIKKYGLLHILRKGLEVDDAFFTLFYQYPLASSGVQVKQKFECNEFSVSRQIRYSLANPREEIDMVIFINGLPISTMELKNIWTGQNARQHGQQQYKNNRDINQTLLNFGRCLVHFTLDPDEVYMTTKLAGKGTFFLPFNKGNNHGKGNPTNKKGHKSAYLWEEVFTRKRLSNLIQHFIRFDGKPKDALKTKTLYFPRFHQMDVVSKILKHASKNGIGHTYLIQHSAGSGKSNSITWAAYQLIETYPTHAAVHGSKGIEFPLFDSVIVVTDRRLLDKQIRENIKSFSEVKNIVAPAINSSDLKEALQQGKKIIISTIQKFPFILEAITDMSDKRFAVIIDEAHSSQSGSTADKMNQVLGKEATADSLGDAQEKLFALMSTRKMRTKDDQERGNVSYMAFTATPKASTLEKFGVEQEDGSFKPFHLYSMKQAIEEGFILDVLANYTTYKSYYEIEKSIQENPLFDTKKAQKKLRKYVESLQQTIDTKAEIMLEHFINNVVKTKKLKGKAKAMIVTQSIEAAIRYHKAINKYLAQKGTPFRTLVAFSGKKKVDGIEYSEEEINTFPSHLDTAKPSDPGYISDKLARFFDQDEFRILIVANKYLTGFDQPKLCTMYVDKKLQGVLAVQALSRLNRSADKLGKKTEDLFILDFFNTTDDLKAAFDDFYTSTSLSKATDVNVLHELKGSLDDLGVYEWSEVEDFVEKYFNSVDAQLLSPIIDVAADRFNSELELEDDEKADFKIKAKQFVKIYGQMASIMPFEVLKWEQLFWFLKFLIPKLIIIDPNKDLLDELLNSVDLSTYGLERVKLNQKIGLDEAETELDPQNPNPRGAHGEEAEKDTLEIIIQNFNERWFQGWEGTVEEQRIKLKSYTNSIEAHPDFQPKVMDNLDLQNRNLAFVKIVNEVMATQRKRDLEMYKKFVKDEGYALAFIDTLKRMTGVDGIQL
jgi:type I restriction enzyme R subunit